MSNSKPKNKYRWLKYTLAVFGSIILLITLAVGFVLITFDDDDYRRLAIWGVEKFTDYTMTIDGVFKLKLSANPSLYATDIRLNAEPDQAPPPIQSIGEFGTRIALSPLLTGNLVVKELKVADAEIEITIDDSEGDDGPESPEDIDLPVFESVQLSNIKLDIIGATDNPIDIRLRRLLLDDVLNAGPMFISGKGSVSGYEFDINGRIGALVAMLRGDKPFPVDCSVSFAGINFSVAGTVKDFIEVEGMELNVSGEADDLADLLRLLEIEMPPLGRLNFEATINQNIEAPEIPFVSVALAGNPDIQFTANGSITNAFNFNGANIDFAGACSIPEIFRLFQAEWLGILERARISGTLQESGGMFSLENVKAEALSEGGAAVSADGRLGLGENIAAMAINNIDLELDAFFPASDMLNPLVFNRLPEISPVKGTGRLTGSLESLVLQDIDLVAGGKGPLQLSSKGWIRGKVEGKNVTLSETDMVTSIQSKNTEVFATAYGAELPALGAITANYHLVGNFDQFRLEEFDFRTVSPEGLKTTFTGAIKFDRKKYKKLVGEFDLKATATAPSVGAATALLGQRYLQDLQGVKINADIAGTTEALSIRNIVVRAGQKGPVRLKINGELNHMPLPGDQTNYGAKLSASVGADSTGALAKVLGINLPELGPVKSSGLFNGTLKQMAASNIRLTTKSPSGLTITASGNIKKIHWGHEQPLSGVALSVKATAPGWAALPGLENIELPALGSLHLDASIKERKNDLDVDFFKVFSSSGDGALLSIQGKILGITDPANQELEASFETASEPWVHAYLGQKDGQNTPLTGDLVAKATDGGVRIESFHLRAAGGKALDLNATGNIKNLKRQAQIDFTINASAPEPVRIGSIAGVSVPKLEPIKISGRVNGKSSNIGFNGNATIGDTKFSANLNSAFISGRPRISGKVAAKTVDLRDIGIYPESSPPKSPADTSTPPVQDRLFGDEPLLPFEALRAVDISLTLDAEKLIDKDISIRNLDIDVELEKGRLSIDPIRMTYSAGYSDFDIVIDASGPIPRYELKIAGEDIDVDDVLARAHEPVIMSGNVTIVADLQSSGHSAREVAGNLNGVLSLALENGQIWRIIDLLAKDALDIILTKVDQRKYTDVHCLINKTTFEDGVGTFDILSVDTPRIRARGAGNIDLNDETFELVVNPQRKRTLFSRRSAVHLSGSLTNPSASTMPLSEAAELYGTIVMPFVFLPARALGFLWSMMTEDKEATPCTFEGG